MIFVSLTEISNKFPYTSHFILRIELTNLAKFKPLTYLRFIVTHVIYCYISTNWNKIYCWNLLFFPDIAEHYIYLTDAKFGEQLFSSFPQKALFCIYISVMTKTWYYFHNFLIKIRFYVNQYNSLNELRLWIKDKQKTKPLTSKSFNFFQEQSAASTEFAWITGVFQQWLTEKKRPSNTVQRIVPVTGYVTV